MKKLYFTESLWGKWEKNPKNPQNLLSIFQTDFSSELMDKIIFFLLRL